MRKSDKIKNFKKVNLLTEHRYLQSKGITGPEIDIDGITDSLVATTLHGGDDNTVYLRAKDSLVDSDEQVKGEFYNVLADKMEANNLSNQAQQYRSIAQQFSNGVEEPKDDLDEYDYNNFDQTYGTLEKNRKDSILQFGKDRQLRYGIKLKSLDGNIKASLSPMLSNDISCRYFKTHTIPDLVDTLSFAAKIYAGNVNTPIDTYKDDSIKKFFDYKAYEIFNIKHDNGNPVIKGYKDITQVVLEFRLPNTRINQSETKNIEIETIGTFTPNNDKVNPPFTYKVEGIKLELQLIPSSPQDAIKLIEIIKAAIKKEYAFKLNGLFISDVIIEKQAFSKGNF
jgi:hypothetical protein